MKSTNFSLKTLEDIFKINWIICLNTYIPIILLPLILIIDSEARPRYSSLLSSVIILFIITSLLTFFVSIIWKIKERRFFIFLFFYFFIYLLYYFISLLYKGNIDMERYTHTSQYSMTDIYSFGGYVLGLITSIPLTIFLYRKFLKSYTLSKKEADGILTLFLIIGLLAIFEINFYGFISGRILILFPIIIFFWIMIYFKKIILKHFTFYLTICVFFLIFPIILCYFIHINFFSHQFAINIQFISSSDIDFPSWMSNWDKLILLSPYQTIIFPLFFNFNAYIIAQKMLEVKYPSTPKDKDFEQILRPDFKTEQERKDWYDNNF